MKKSNGEIEPQDTWGRLLDELTVLGREDNVNDQQLLDAINKGTNAALLPYLKQRSLVEYFIDSTL